MYRRFLENSRERVLKAINHKEPDRVPIDIGGLLATTIHRIIYNKLKKEFGLKDGKKEILEFALQRLYYNLGIINSKYLYIFFRV